MFASRWFVQGLVLSSVLAGRAQLSVPAYVPILGRRSPDFAYGRFVRHREFWVGCTKPATERPPAGPGLAQLVSTGVEAFDPGIRCRWIKMTTTHLYLYARPPVCPGDSAPPLCSLNFRPAEFSNHRCTFSRDLAPAFVDRLDLGTVSADEVRRDWGSFKNRYGEVDGRAHFCSTVSGCPSKGLCRDPSYVRHEWRICSTDSRALVRWMRAVDAAYLRINNIAARLPQLIADACDDCKRNNNSQLRFVSNPAAPDTLAPMLACAPGPEERLLAMEKLIDVTAAFEEGTIAFRPDRSSRSGAIFFYSRNKEYLAKRVRRFEYNELWRLTGTCEYSRWLDGTSSIISPIFLAFFSSPGERHWVISQVEHLPPGVAQHMPAQPSRWRSDFTYDIKPAPMRSDRAEVVDVLSKTYVTTHLQMSKLGAVERILGDRIMHGERSDVGFLHAQNLIDYSIYMYGSILTYDPYDAESRRFFEEDSSQRRDLELAVANTTSCAFGCSRRKLGLVDVTRHLDEEGYAVHDGTTYKCCCVELRPGDVGALLSPCQLVDVGTAGPSSWFSKQLGCGNLVGKGGHHLFHDKVGYLNGRCVVAKDAPKPFLPPEALGRSAGAEADGLPDNAACGLFCFSIIDYLMPLNFKQRLENLALVAYYGEAKWTDYHTKVRSLVSCLAAPPLPRSSPRLTAPFLNPSGFVTEEREAKCKRDFSTDGLADGFGSDADQIGSE